MYLETCGSFKLANRDWARKSATHKNLLGAPTANSQVATFVEGLLIFGFWDLRNLFADRPPLYARNPRF
jgi:hypothetical protein